MSRSNFSRFVVGPLVVFFSFAILLSGDSRGGDKGKGDKGKATPRK